MSDLDDLVARLKLDISDYEKNAKKAEKATDSLEKETKDLEKTNKSAGDSFDKLMTAFTGLNQAVQLVQQAYQILQKGYQAVITETVAYAEEVRSLSRTIGASAEDSSKLIQAADDVKVSYESLTTGMQIAIRNGLEPTVEGMGELADQYVAIQDPIARAKFLLDNFGRSGSDLAPLLEIGSEGIRELGIAAEETGLVLDQDAIDATRNYEIAVDNLNDKLSGMATNIGIKVIPSITDLLDTINNTTVDTDGIAGFIKTQVDSTTLMVLQFQQMGLAFQALSERAITLTEFMGYLNNSFFGTYQDAYTLTNDINELNTALGNGAPMLDATNATKEMEAATITLGKQLEIEKKNYEAAADVLENRLAAAYEEVERAEESWRTGVAGDIKSEVDKQWEEGKLSIEDYQSALATLDSTYGTGYLMEFKMEQEIPDLVEKLLTDPASFVTAAKAFEDYFLPLDESVQDAKKVVEELQIQLNALERDYKVKVSVITSGSTGLYGSSGGGGGVDSNPNIEAGGGIVKAGQSIIWGEYGFEPFIPAEDGRILSHADAMNAIGGGGDGENSAMLNMILLELRDLPQSIKMAMQEAMALVGG